MLSPVPPLLLQVLQMLLLTSRSVQTSRCHQPIRGQEVSVTAMFLLHVSGVGVGLFWRGEDRHSGGILQGNAAREAPLTELLVRVVLFVLFVVLQYMDHNYTSKLQHESI